MIFDRRHAPSHIQCFTQTNGTSLLDPVNRMHRRAFRVIGQDRLCVERDRIARYESRVCEFPVDAVRNIAVAVQAALLLRRHDDLENREIVTDFGAI